MNRQIFFKLPLRGVRLLRGVKPLINGLQKIMFLLAVGFLAINTVFLDSLQAKQKKSTEGNLKAFSSKYFIEGAYPYVVASDWLAVHHAYKAVGKLENAKLALEFSNRLEALAKVKAKANEIKEEKKEAEKMKSTEEPSKKTPKGSL